MQEDEARREEQEKARVRNQQIEAEKLERERENEALRKQLQEAQEAKSAQAEAEKVEKDRQEVEALQQQLKEAKEAIYNEASEQRQMREDMQYNHSMEVTSLLQQERQGAEAREKALQDKIAKLEKDNQRLQSRMEMRPSEMERTLQDMQMSSPRSRPSR